MFWTFFLLFNMVWTVWHTAISPETLGNPRRSPGDPRKPSETLGNPRKPSVTCHETLGNPRNSSETATPGNPRKPSETLGKPRRPCAKPSETLGNPRRSDHGSRHVHACFSSAQILIMMMFFWRETAQCSPFGPCICKNCELLRLLVVFNVSLWFFGQLCSELIGNWCVLGKSSVSCRLRSDFAWLVLFCCTSCLKKAWNGYSCMKCIKIRWKRSFYSVFSEFQGNLGLNTWFWLILVWKRHEMVIPAWNASNLDENARFIVFSLNFRVIWVWTHDFGWFLSEKGMKWLFLHEMHRI